MVETVHFSPIGVERRIPPPIYFHRRVRRSAPVIACFDALRSIATLAPTRGRVPSGRSADLTFFRSRLDHAQIEPMQVAGDDRMGKRLYVGNLPYSTTDADLAAMFAPFGKVTSGQVIQDRDTGRSKGFAFVEMSTDAEAQAAITELNEKEVNGRPLTVNEAKPRENSPRGGGGGGGGGGGYRRY